MMLVEKGNTDNKLETSKASSESSLL